MLKILSSCPFSLPHLTSVECAKDSANNRRPGVMIDLAADASIEGAQMGSQAGTSPR